MDMIHYNNLAWWEEANNETKEYFEVWENFNTNPALADNVQLTCNDINNIMDNTCVPWVTVPDISVPWQDIHKEAIALLEAECFTVHRAVGSGGWLSACIHGMSSVHTNCPEDYGLPDSAKMSYQIGQILQSFVLKRNNGCKTKCCIINLPVLDLWQYCQVVGLCHTRIQIN